MITDSETAKMFVCSTCSSLDCKRPWKIKFCWECNGYEADCELCRGSGIVEVGSCPRMLADQDSHFLLPYFYQWYHNGCIHWPNGRPSLEQPAKLSKAFYFLKRYFDEKIKDK